MFSGTDDRVESADGAFTDALRRLKRQGASVLVVGTVQPEQRRDICRRLFGQAPDRDRRRVFVSTAGTIDDLSTIVDDPTSDAFRLLTYDAPARSAAADTTAISSSATPTLPHTETDSLAELGIAISSTIEEFDTDADGLEPSALRVGVDSLLPLLEEYGRERVFTFLHLTNGRTRDVGGMIHYHLPVERDATVVSVLSSLFDVLVELREQNGRQQERWTLSDGQYCSGWITPPRA